MWFIIGLILGVGFTATTLLIGVSVLGILARAFRIDKTVAVIVGMIIVLPIFIAVLANYVDFFLKHRQMIAGGAIGCVFTLMFAFRDAKN